jgi:hypothetical protein
MDGTQRINSTAKTVFFMEKDLFPSGEIVGGIIPILRNVCAGRVKSILSG